ncbi:unnamed protein product, partial [Urochloa humidicola]
RKLSNRRELIPFGSGLCDSTSCKRVLHSPPASPPSALCACPAPRASIRLQLVSYLAATGRWLACPQPVPRRPGGARNGTAVNSKAGFLCAALAVGAADGRGGRSGSRDTQQVNNRDCRRPIEHVLAAVTSRQICARTSGGLLSCSPAVGTRSSRHLTSD